MPPCPIFHQMRLIRDEMIKLKTSELDEWHGSDLSVTRNLSEVKYRNPSEKFRIDESKSPHLNSKNNMVAQLGAKLEIH